jgi:competence protein ComEC
LVAGLAVAPLGESFGSLTALALPGGCALALALARPRSRAANLTWLALLALACAAAGLLLGAARLRAIDAGAYSPAVGSRLEVRGYVAAVPRRSDGEVRVRVDTPRGRISVQAPEPVADLPIGAGIEASGIVTRPPPWLVGNLRLHGIDRVLRAPRIELTGARRGGLEGRIDSLRLAAEAALGRGMPAEQAALARGFVLGEDDRIPAATVTDFQRSGLAHHLAVSGENVVLLALLATPLLAALAIPLRARLAWLLALIAIYVPLAGGGAMGAAAVVATLAGRPASRLYALLLALAATLALNPRTSSDVGWQLSFAAVIGIFLLAAPLRDLLTPRLGSGGWRRALAEGIAVTIAATVATAPLMAHHFEALSLTSLLANVLALPAIAPAMWLGMIVAALGQAPAIPVEPLNWLNSLLLAYVGQVAAWMAAPGWARVGVGLGSWAGVAAAYALLAAVSLGLRGWAAGRVGMRLGGAAVRRLSLAAGLAALATVAALGALGLSGSTASPPPAGLRVSVLDVGQGDAILLQPANAPAVLVDGGPPGDDLRRKLAAAGAGSLGAAVVTHDQSDHAGGIEELLGTVPIHRLVYAELGRHLLSPARADGIAPLRVAEGSELRSGRLHLEVLWPPRALLAGPPPQDPNTECLVLLARWGHFEMLLTGDAEAEAVPLDPGPIDVLKVSHHGSADAGLGGLLDRTAPSLAVISVGRDNPYGHPDPSTLATLAAHHVAVMRTDVDATVTIDVSASSIRVRSG